MSNREGPPTAEQARRADAMNLLRGVLREFNYAMQWDGVSPFMPDSVAAVDVEPRRWTVFTLEDSESTYYSDESSSPPSLLDMPLPEDDDDSLLGYWREMYLEFMIALRACPTRRQAAGLPAADCSRDMPCSNCLQHPGATVTSVHWRCMSDAGVEQELAAYMLERDPRQPDWEPPAGAADARSLPPFSFIFDQCPEPFDFEQCAAPSGASDGNFTMRRPGPRTSVSNQASPASSVRSEPPSPTEAAPSGPSTSRPVFGPPRPPPAYEDLSD
ncbi:hypothetical protein AURDEDRAFT_126680 [Auricularia subglabra TFB-10046 SS5]|nr:hypothetical protein AURDEDRAFT_126680 [Auricularia subglabra TFB-10046 SS5]